MFNDLKNLIRKIYGEGSIPLHAPVLNQADKDEVIASIESGFVSSVGPHVTKFEEDLAQYTGSKKAVAVMNGTAALHLSLLLANVKSEDYVISQGLTFIATANAISYTGATPIFLDSDPVTMGLSASALQTFLVSHAKIENDLCVMKSDGKVIRACVPMHVFGHPVEIEKILKICHEWKLFLIEDAAEALGSTYRGKHLGTFAPIGVLSFNGNKIITTGGGGALIFSDEELARKAKHLSTTAKIPHAWEFRHDEVGFNYRMPNLNAALGCAQLKRLPEFLKIKRKIASDYEKFFKNNSDVTFVGAQEGSNPNFWLNAVLVRDKETRDTWLRELNEEKIMCRPVWELMTTLPMYSACPRDELRVAHDLSNRLINLPSGVPT